MEQKELIHQILQLTQEIENRTANLVEVEQLSRIDVDLTLETTRNLYDLLISLQKTIEIQPQPSKVKVTEKIPIEISPEVEPEEELIDLAQFEKETNPIPELQPEIIPEIVEAVQEEAIEVKQVQETPIQPQAVKLDADIAQKLGMKPISNIASAIGINDKFQFIQELFNKNANEYNATISHLNSLPSFIEAQAFVTSKYSWDFDEDTTVIKFMNIIERRYL